MFIAFSGKLCQSSPFTGQVRKDDLPDHVRVGMSFEPAWEHAPHTIILVLTKHPWKISSSVSANAYFCRQAPMRQEIFQLQTAGYHRPSIQELDQRRQGISIVRQPGGSRRERWEDEIHHIHSEPRMSAGARAGCCHGDKTVSELPTSDHHHTSAVRFLGFISIFLFSCPV